MAAQFRDPRHRTSWSVIHRSPPCTFGDVVTVIAPSAAARLATGSSKRIEIGCATTIVMSSRGKDEAAVLLSRDQRGEAGPGPGGLTGRVPGKAATRLRPAVTQLGRGRPGAPIAPEGAANVLAFGIGQPAVILVVTIPIVRGLHRVPR